MFRKILGVFCFFCFSNLLFGQCKTLSIVSDDPIFISGITSTFKLTVSPINSDERIIFKINGNQLDSNVYKTVGSGVGIYKIIASAEIYKNKKLIETLHQTYSYLVTQPMVNWDGPNSNILFADIEQVLYVSIPGVSPNSTSLSLEGAKIISSFNGKYTIKPDSGARSVSAFCSAKLPDGTIRKMGGYKLRVLELDLPEAQLNSSKPNIVVPDSILILKNLKSISLNLTYKIKSFSVIIIKDNKAQRYSMENNVFSNEIKIILKSLKTSDVIIVDDIICQITSIGEKQLKPIVHTIK